jgi:threonine synthase
VANGCRQFVDRGRIECCPRIHCVQPAGNDTIAGSLRDGLSKAANVECTTSISGLQVPSVIDGDQVIAACRAPGGTGHVVVDADV